MMNMIYIDCDELAVRISEACISAKRPDGMTAADAVGQLRARDKECADRFMRAALAAAKYVAECCNTVNPGSVQVKIVVSDSQGSS